MTEKLTFEEANQALERLLAYRPISVPILKSPIAGVSDDEYRYRQVMEGGFRQILGALHASYAPLIEMTPVVYEFIKNEQTIFGDLTISEWVEESSSSAVTTGIHYLSGDELEIGIYLKEHRRDVEHAWYDMNSVINSETGKPFVEE